MIFQVLLEGLGLGVLLVLVCWFGIRKGAVGMVHLYHEDVQERCVKLGLTTREKSGGTACFSKPAAFRGISPTCSSAYTPSTERAASGRACGSCSSFCPS